jgi:hemerythrin
MWKPEYNLGIPIVDEQHRGVVATINSLYYGMQNKHADTMLRPVIEMINNYTTIHFETEEDFLKKCGYPDLEQHLELHNELKKKLSSVGKKSIWEQDPSQFMEFLKTWWIDHICKKDWLFRDYLLK